MTESFIVNEYEHDNCYVIEAPEANIRAITSDHDLARHIFDFLAKQHGRSYISEYCDVDVTHFIAAEDTPLARKVTAFVNDLQENYNKEVEEKSLVQCIVDRYGAERRDFMTAERIE